MLPMHAHLGDRVSATTGEVQNFDVDAEAIFTAEREELARDVTRNSLKPHCVS